MIPIVLFFHQVVRQARNEHYSLRSANVLDRFRELMTTVRSEYHPLGIDEFIWIQRNGRRWPKRAVLVTFDDGFKNNLWAAKILRDLGMQATFFVVSGAVGTRFQPWYVRFGELITHRHRDAWACSWGAVDFQNEFSRRRWLKRTKEYLLALRPGPRNEALQELADAVGAPQSDAGDADLDFFSPPDLRQIQEWGMTVGGHSRTHDNLAACDATELRSEILESADELEQHTGTPVRYFCYPDGRFNTQVVDLVRQRFDAAFTTACRYTAPDLWRFPRRSADGCRDIRPVLSPWFPAKRKAINAAKRMLNF